MHSVTPAQQKLGFNIHAFVVCRHHGAACRDQYLEGPAWWVLWVLLGWGIGLVSHWFFTLGPGAKDSVRRLPEHRAASQSALGDGCPYSTIFQ